MLFRCEIREEYAAQASRVQVIHQDTCGASAARNVGMQKAKGKHTIFVDSDNWACQDHAEVLLRLVAGFDVDIAFVSKAKQSQNSFHVTHAGP